MPVYHAAQCKQLKLPWSKPASPIERASPIEPAAHCNHFVCHRANALCSNFSTKLDRWQFRTEPVDSLTKETTMNRKQNGSNLSGNRLPYRTNRRQFLQGITAAGASTFVFARSLPAAVGFSSPLERPVMATIGLRNQGWAITRKALPFADFVALADVDAGILENTAGKLQEKQESPIDTYTDYRRVLQRQDVDAVMIATPDHWHAKIAIEAMLSGKDVYCEKPLTLTIEEGKLIEQTVKRTGRVFQVGTQQRSESEQRFLQAIAMVRDARVGEIAARYLWYRRHESLAKDSRSARSAGIGLGFLVGACARGHVPRLARNQGRLRRWRSLVQQCPLCVSQLASVFRWQANRLGSASCRYCLLGDR